MISEGNGTRERCALNLIKTVRGEVPYERTKGMDRRIIDSPAVEFNAVKQDVSWLMKTYEPRINDFDISLENDNADQGQFGIDFTVK